MKNQLGLQGLVIAVSLMSFTAESAFAGNKIKIVDPSRPQDRLGKLSGKLLGKNTPQGVAVGAGVAAAGATAGVGTLAYLGATGVIGGTVALSTAGAFTLGIVPGSLLVGGAAAYGAYRLYQKYKNHLMGVPSPIVAKLSQDAVSAGRNPDDVVKRYLKMRLDAICRANNYAGGVDLNGTKIEERKVNLTSKLRGKFLSAINENGQEQNYAYVQGYPSIIVRKLQCIDPNTDVVIQDPFLRTLYEQLNQEAVQAQRQPQLQPQSAAAGPRDLRMVAVRQAKPEFQQPGAGVFANPQLPLSTATSARGQ